MPSENIMTVGEVKNMFKDQYADVEYYRNTFNCTHQIDFNLEYCTSVDACEVNDDMETVSYQLADEDTYDKTVLANSEIAADFEDWYENKDAKVLCILL